MEDKFNEFYKAARVFIIIRVVLLFSTVLLLTFIFLSLVVTAGSVEDIFKKCIVNGIAITALLILIVVNLNLFYRMNKMYSGEFRESVGLVIATFVVSSPIAGFLLVADLCTNKRKTLNKGGN